MSLDCLTGGNICKFQASLLLLQEMTNKMNLPFLIFCVSKTAFLQLLSNRKQLSKEFLVTLEASNLNSGENIVIFSSFNTPDEKEMLLRGREGKNTGISGKYLFSYHHED